jgi:hypothetical protein
MNQKLYKGCMLETVTFSEEELYFWFFSGAQVCHLVSPRNWLLLLSEEGSSPWLGN